MLSANSAVTEPKTFYSEEEIRRAVETRAHPLPLPPNFGNEELRAFLTEATRLDCSDVLLQAGDYAWGDLRGRQVRLTQRTIKDGELQSLIGVCFGNELLGIIKSARDDDRAYQYQRDGETYRFRVNISSAQIGGIESGISITLRMIPDDPPDLDSLGLPPGIRDNLYQPRGLVLICGPTGSGKTTTLAAFYKWVSETMGDVKILLYESPIEFLYEKVKNIGPRISQMQVGKHIQSFVDGIRNSLRRGPKLIGIGEARDMATISAAIGAALTGHGTCATLHTESVSESVTRLIQEFPGDQHSAIASKLLGALRLIVVQILVPTNDGKRAAVREYLYFDMSLRRKLSAMPYIEWGAYLREVVADKHQDMASGLRALLQAGRIDEATYKKYAGEVVD